MAGENHSLPRGLALAGATVGGTGTVVGLLLVVVTAVSSARFSPYS